MVVTHVFDVEPFRPEMYWDPYTGIVGNCSVAIALASDLD